MAPWASCPTLETTVEILRSVFQVIFLHPWQPYGRFYFHQWLLISFYCRQPKNPTWHTSTCKGFTQSKKWILTKVSNVLKTSFKISYYLIPYSLFTFWMYYQLDIKKKKENWAKNNEKRYKILNLFNPKKHFKKSHTLPINKVNHNKTD